MIRDTVGDWQELSALYEQADALDAAGLAALLAKLREHNHRLLPQLRRMLNARDRVAEGDFLAELPAISAQPQALVFEWTEGSRIGAYRLVRHIGSGGMAEVWLADRVDGAFERQVAIKLLFNHPSRQQRANLVERFRRERDILASLHHRNIAPLHDAGVTPSGQPWLALEYVEGEPITSWCDRKKLTPKERIRVFLQVLRAVEYAHSSLVIHRDLKPGNILVTESAEVRLLDFGIAKLLEPELKSLESTELTKQGGRPLTLAYASPEQVLGKPLTTSCDLYSLGVVLYELVCGERPFGLESEGMGRLQDAIVHTDPMAPSRRALHPASAAARNSTPSTLRRVLAPDVDAIVLKALQKQPEDRYASVDALRADLTRWLGNETVLARVPSLRYRAAKFISRHRVGVTMSTLAASSLVAVAALATVFGVRAQRESTRAVESRNVFLDMVKQADPDRTRGGSVTAKEILEGGQKRIEAKFAGQPEVQAELFASLGDLQSSIGEKRSAEVTLGRVVDIYRNLGDRRRLAIAQVAYASEVLRMGDNERAQSVVDEAIRTAVDYPSDLALREKLLDVRGALAWQRNSLSEGEGLMAEALKLSTELYGPSDPHSIDLLSDLVSLTTERAKSDEARSYLTLLIDRTRLARPAAPTALFRIELQRAKIDISDGWYDRARIQLSDAIARCTQTLGGQDEWCLLLTMSQAETQLRLGRNVDALALLPALSAQADSDFSPRRQAESLITVCRILAANDRLPLEDPLRRRLIAFGLSGAEIPQVEGIKVKALLAEAEASVREGRGQAALEVLGESAKRISQSPELQADGALNGRQELLTGLAWLVQADTVSSMASFVRARTRYEQAFGASHVLVRVVDLDIASVHRFAGRLSDAERLEAAVAPALKERFGPDSPVIRAINVPSVEGRSVRGSSLPTLANMFFT